MFELEIQYYLDRASGLVEGRETIPLTEVLASAIVPPQVRRFIQTEVRCWEREERLAASVSRFRRDDAEVRALEERLSDALVRTAVLSTEEYRQLVERAVKVTFNYLCRPELTMRSVVFRGAPSIDVDEALLRIDHFLDYPYFAAVLKPWLQRKRSEHIDQITPESFEKTLATIDDRLLGSYTVQDLHGLLQPMAKWISDAQGAGGAGTPTDAYVIFFDDKRIVRIAEHLAALAIRRPTLTPQEVCVIVEQIINGTEDTAPPPSGATTYAPPLARDDEEDEEEEERERVEAAHTEEHAFPSIEAPDAAGSDREAIPVAPIPFVQEYEPASEARPETVEEAQLTREPAFELAPSTEPIVVDQTEQLTPVSELPPQLIAEQTIIEEPWTPVAVVEESSPTEDNPVEAGTFEEVTPLEEVAPAESMPEEESLEEDEDTIEEELAREVVQPPPPIAPAPPVPASPVEAPKTLRAVIGSQRFSDRSSEFSIVGARQEATPMADLHTLIDDATRRKFIRKLFRRNDAEYERALDALNAHTSWKEAAAAIDSLFLKHGVDPYSKVAIQFTDVIYSRFVKAPPTR